MRWPCNDLPHLQLALGAADYLIENGAATSRADYSIGGRPRVEYPGLEDR